MTLIVAVVVVVGDAAGLSWHKIVNGETVTLGDPLAGVRCSDPGSFWPGLSPCDPAWVRLGDHDTAALDGPGPRGNAARRRRVGLSEAILRRCRSPWACCSGRP
jgi:hypothetical protein